MGVEKVRCIPNNEKGGDFPIQSLKKRWIQRKGKEVSGTEREHTMGFREVICMHSGETVPAGNWSLIASEVERDQLA